MHFRNGSMPIYGEMAPLSQNRNLELSEVQVHLPLPKCSRRSRLKSASGLSFGRSALVWSCFLWEKHYQNLRRNTDSFSDDEKFSLNCDSGFCNRKAISVHINGKNPTCGSRPSVNLVVTTSQHSTCSDYHPQE